MGVNTNDNNDSPASALGDSIRQAQERNAQASASTTTQTQTRQTIGGLQGLQRMRPVARNTNGAALAALQKAFQKQLENSLTMPGMAPFFELIPMDAGTNLTAFSNLLLTMKVQNNGKQAVAVFAMIVEGSGTRLDTEFLNFGGRQVAIERVASDTIGTLLRNKIMNVVTATHGVKEDDVIEVGAIVVPSEFNPENEQEVHQLVYRVTQAAFTVMDAAFLHQEVPLTIAALTDGLTTSALTTYENCELTNSVGLPVRSDVSVVLRAHQPVDKNNRTDANSEQTLPLTRVDGYVDLLWSEPMMQNLPYGAQPAPQRYVPRFVITALDSEQSAITLESQLLGLHAAGILTQNRAWMGALRNQRFAGGRDIHDIGAIGLELNPKAPARVITNDGSFGDQQLADLVALAIHDSLQIAIDVAEADENTWVNQLFVEAAEGGNSIKGRDARTAIIAAADRLTNGNFGRIWNVNDPITFDNKDRIHLGYYLDEQGHRQDIRNLDYLAVLNLQGEKDINVLYAYSRTFDNTEMPAEIRTEERGQIIRGIEPSYRLKGYARRVVFNPAFILALAAACDAAGLQIRPERLFTVYGTGAQRGNYNPLNYGLSGASLASSFRFAPNNVYGNNQGNNWQNRFYGSQGRFAGGR